MEWLILTLMAAAFAASFFSFFLLRMEPAADRKIRLDGDHYDVDEMLAAFGKTEEWV